jgi:hypothetical protein
VCAWDPGNFFFAIASDKSHVYLLRLSGALVQVLKCSDWNFGSGVADLKWRKYSEDTYAHFFWRKLRRNDDSTKEGEEGGGIS